MKVSKFFLLCLILLVILLGMYMSADAEQMKLEVTMTPFSLERPGVFGYDTLPSETFIATFLFDDIYDQNTSLNYIEIPYGYYTMNGNWGNAIHAGWDESMQYGTSGTIYFNLAQSEFSYSLRFDNSYNETLIFGMTYGASQGVKMVDGLSGSLHSLASYSYNVVPEPISSILFITGGATLGFRRFRMKFENRGI